MTIELGIEQEQEQTTQQELIHNLEYNLDVISDITRTLYEDDQRLVPEIAEIFMNSNPELNEERLKKTLQFAKELHIGQYRDSGHPSVVHSYHTGFILAEWKLKKDAEDAVITGTLHDCIEDSPDPDRILLQIYEEFGVTNMTAVAALSKNYLKNQQNVTQEDREMYLRIKLFADEYALGFINHVKVADNIANLYTKQYMKPQNGMTAEQRQQRFRRTSEKYVLPLAREIDRSGTLEMCVAPYIQELIAR